MRKTPTLTQELPGVRRIVARLWPYIRQQGGLLLVSLLALLAEVACHSLEPWPLKFVLDHLLRSRHQGRLAGLAARLQDFDAATLLLLAAGAVVVIITLRALPGYASAYGFAVAANRIL